MAKYGKGGMSGGSITYGVNFAVDNTELQKARKALEQLSNIQMKDLVPNSTVNDLNKVKKSANELQEALTKSFNNSLGTLNVTKFNQELNKLDLKSIYSNFQKAGASGEQAFRKITSQILTTNLQLKQTNNLVDRMGTTLGNSLKWTISSSITNRFLDSIQGAYSYIKGLDSSLNDIRIVTGKSADEMAAFADKANKAAGALGQQTTAYTNASLIYYQQGLDTDAAEKLAEITLKVANITQQSSAAVSEEITAVMNGYKMGADQVEGAFDSLAAVAASTASDLQEISTGMSKVASAANAMGVPLDSLNAQLATIVSVTRQAPEAVGTALKTIYSRLGDLQIDGQDEFGVSLGSVSSTMQEMGIQILDESGNLRDMGDVITEVGEKWQTWTKAQRQAMAIAMAGKRLLKTYIGAAMV